MENSETSRNAGPRQTTCTALPERARYRLRPAFVFFGVEYRILQLAREATCEQQFVLRIFLPAFPTGHTAGGAGPPSVHLWKTLVARLECEVFTVT